MLSNFADKPINSFIFTAIKNSPKLPDDPFTYNEVNFPKHLAQSRDTIIDTGYGSGPIDTSTFINLNNDVVTLGRVLFYDEKLSALENISCASCHKQELSFTDDVDFSEGISSPTRRNSMQLNDLGWSNRSHFFWDMSESDLHEMIVLPLTDENEIGANMDDVEAKLLDTDYYPTLFSNAFGSTQITEEKIVDALVQFISSMNTFESKFDKASRNNFEDFNEKEIVGLELFGEFCGSCHSQGSHDPFGFGFGMDATDFFASFSALDMFPEIFNNGIKESHEDKGAGEWREGSDNLFKIPTLRNIAVTGPYMHDGRFETLEEVVNHYSEEVEENEWTFFFLPSGGFNFSDFEKEALIAFLHTLTDESFLTDEKWANPFEETVPTLEVEDLEIVIKPNPMMERAEITFNNELGEITEINILNASGQLIKKHQTQNSFLELNKNEFAEGIYFIQIQKGEQQSLQKLIVN